MPKTASLSMMKEGLPMRLIQVGPTTGCGLRRRRPPCVLKALSSRSARSAHRMNDASRFERLTSRMLPAFPGDGYPPRFTS
jgi:hypothetical protein